MNRMIAALTFIAGIALPGDTPVAAQDYIVVDTDQDVCYDNIDEITCPTEGQALYGQDAQYSGNTPSCMLSGGRLDRARQPHGSNLAAKPGYR